MPVLQEARYVRGYILRFRFDDGIEGEVDLKDELTGEMFEPLRDLELFKRFRVDPEMRAVIWDNSADLAPEFLYSKVTTPT